MRHMGVAVSRKSFIQSQGATCRNWTWSWAFINNEKRLIIFGAWDKHTEGSRSLILDESWAQNEHGRKSPAFSEAKEYLRLVEEKDYKLFTFPMIHSAELQDEAGHGPAKIKGFRPVLTQKSLLRVSGKWLASDDIIPTSIPEEISQSERYIEGASRTVSVNAYERNAKARDTCIRHYGAKCAACNFNFESAYGALGKGYIHVHHIVPLANIRKEYVLDPIRDLIPVCPNCHAIIHLAHPALTLAELRACLAAARDA